MQDSVLSLDATTCPTCGHGLQASTPAPSHNARRDVSLTIAEEHVFIFRMIFQQMNLRFGMMGQGEFANLLPAYAEQLGIDKDVFRYFDDVTVSYLMLAIERGYHLTTNVEAGGTQDYQGNARVKVTALLTHPEDKKAIEVTLSGGAPEDKAKIACHYLEDAFRRLAQTL